MLFVAYLFMIFDSPVTIDLAYILFPLLKFSTGEHIFFKELILIKNLAYSICYFTKILYW